MKCDCTLNESFVSWGYFPYRPKKGRIILYLKLKMKRKSILKDEK